MDKYFFIVRRLTVTKSLLLAVCLLAGPARAAERTLIRFPNASATDIAFVARGMLWTTPLAGGTARRLTAGNISGVTAPRFSPNGRWIAFTGRHDGAYDVFVISSVGGSPRRLTFDAASGASGNLVVTWTPDSRRVVFLSNHDSPMKRILQAYSVAVGGGKVQRLPLDSAGLLSYGPTGHVIALNRFFRNFELRKRYLGGQAQAIFTYDLDSHALARITDWKGTSTAPMWSGKRIYFLSDRGAGFRANIWACNADGSGLRQITHFADLDVDYPSLGGRTITF